MRTISNNTSGAALHDYPAECDVCGSVWLRSAMRISEGGTLECPQHKGADETELSRLNAEMAEPYSLRLDRDIGIMRPYDGPAGTYIDDLWEETFGQPLRDPLEEL